ncbi:MAG: TIGR01458 family HAD-type hydrolase [Actinomycetota bacterium]|nr:TIGR01458 family HAD-type hydrolase [Actinomycetota bacterium]MDH5225155.1 TIGR01458 family HAD-type hydrolase [Actinomycetota bacterium]MDH5314383.1 TIGR01458 family HAD-type hydrolase [Actinomycetota bacterium]
MADSLDVDAVLLDIDGVLVTSWDALPGALEAVATLRAHGVAFKLITNTTTHTRSALAETMRRAGFDIVMDELVTAVSATASYLRAHHVGARVFVLSDGDPRADLTDVQLVDVDDADVVVLGGGCDDFSYDILNRVFRRLNGGAGFVAMHRNLYWRTRDGLQLDGGAFVAALEEASGVKPVICGKPSPAYFAAALGMLGVDASRAAMVGDDIANDVAGAQAAGLAGVLVRTGKFRPSDLERGRPDSVVASIADVPALLGLAG